MPKVYDSGEKIPEFGYIEGDVTILLEELNHEEMYALLNLFSFASGLPIVLQEIKGQEKFFGFSIKKVPTIIEKSAKKI